MRRALDKVEDLDDVFTHEGYSFKAGALGGIDTKFKINTEAVILYEQYTTDSDDNTLETPYTATVTKGETVSVVNILAVRDFVPIISNDDE